jgi:hypothetical protein
MIDINLLSAVENPDNAPPKSMSKGAQFWGFRCSRVRGVLGGISSIPLDYQVLVDQILVMEYP